MPAEVLDEGWADASGHGDRFEIPADEEEFPRLRIEHAALERSGYCLEPSVIQVAQILRTGVEDEFALARLRSFTRYQERRKRRIEPGWRMRVCVRTAEEIVEQGLGVDDAGEARVAED